MKKLDIEIIRILRFSFAKKHGRYPTHLHVNFDDAVDFINSMPRILTDQHNYEDGKITVYGMKMLRTYDLDREGWFVS